MQYIPETGKDYLWWRDGVLYQIYPRSFMDANGDGIGDLKGIISRLDYLAELGVDGIWLSPIYPSPDADFGYDVSDYRDIDPKFGSLADFDRLIAEAHKRSIKVIMDMVLNHTSNQHPWFREAQKSKDNPYHDYYIWQDPKHGHEPNNWQSIFGGKGWEFVPACGQYYYHMFCKEQPDLNWRNPQVYQEMMDLFRFWAGRGVDGFRLDAFSMYYKDAKFRNNPPALGLRAFDRQRHIHDTNQPEMIQAVQDIRKVVDEFPERYVVGEPFMGDAKLAAKFCKPGLLTAVFNFTYAEYTKWSASSFRRSILEWEQVLNNESWPNYTLSNHDIPRAASRFGLGKYDDRLKCAAAMTIMLRGTPFLYYGEEIGMRDGNIKKEELLDPVGKKYWPFNKGRDGCRTPMQWNKQKNSGFSSEKPWLPINKDYENRNVNVQVYDKNSLLFFYKDLIALRKHHRVLQRGDMRMIDAKNESVLAFLRTYNSEAALICVNFTQMPCSVDLREIDSKIKWKQTFTNKKDALDKISDGKLKLAGEQVVIFIK